MIRVAPRRERAPLVRAVAWLSQTIAGLACGVLLATGGGGCWQSAPVTVDFSTPARSYGGSEYQEIYERWTRHEKIMHGVDSPLEVWATYKSQEFREGFVAHYADSYSMSEDARANLSRAQHDAAAANYEFVVTAQSSNYKWNDLEKKSSPWRVLLIDRAGHELIADQIVVERFPDLFEREFFPAKTPFSKIYSIRFARNPGHDDFQGERSGELTLRFAGPRGHGDLRWAERP